MSEYIPKYPSKEGDDSNKTSSELLAETLKPIYVPQDLMLAWESHLASYSRDTNVLLDQVKDSELALNTQYQALLARVQKYEQMLQDITMDSNEFTMDSDVVNFTGWNILAQASYWDYILRKEITKLSDQIKSAEYKGELVADVSDSVLESLSTGNQYISNIIGALTDSPLIRDLDAALSGTSTGLSDLRLAHETLKAKQYADALALAAQNGETFDQLTLTFNNLISEQIDRIADEAATRTRVIQELEDGITTESQLRYEGQEAIATQVLAIKTSTETAIAGIKQDYSTIAGTNEAITTALNTYSAQVDETIATILTDYVSYANLDYALTSKTDKLMSIINNNVAQLTVTNEISASLNKVRAVNTLSVDINGVVSGYGLISTLENGVVQSAFGVNADTFYIGKPTDAVKPFVVTSVPKNIDGIDFPAGTWINSAIIANATIGSAHIANASITDAHIVSLNASKITAGIIDAERIGANSISVEKLMVGDATNLWGNQHFNPNGPLLGGNRTRIVTDMSALKGNGMQLGGRDHIAPYASKIPIKEGDTFVIEYIAGRNAGPDVPLSVGLWTYNISGNQGSAPYQYGPAEQIANLGSGWFRWRRIFKVTNHGHAGTVAYGVLYFQIEQSEIEPNPAYWSVGDVTVRKGVGGELIVNGAITADKIQVGSLSAISANLGTIKVGTANIDDLSVTSLKIADRAITSSMSSAVIFTPNVQSTARGRASVITSTTIYGLDLLRVGSRAILFLQSDIQVGAASLEPDNVASKSSVDPGTTSLKIYLDNKLVITVRGNSTYGGLLTTTYYGSDDGSTYTSIVGSYTNASVPATGTIMIPFDIISQLPYASELRFEATASLYSYNTYRSADIRVNINANYLETYTVEFLK